MSTNVISTVATTDLFTTWANAYNQVVWELNNDVLRTERTVTGNLTSNASLSTFGLVLNSITVNASTDSTNTLENRGGVLFFNDKRIDLVNEYLAVYGYSFNQGLANTARLTFSTSTTAAHTPANLSSGRSRPASISDRQTYGYTMGGYTGILIATVTTDRTTFSTSVTAAATASNLPAGRYSTGGVSDGAVYGYISGGYSIDGDPATTGFRLTFATQTISTHTPAENKNFRGDVCGISDSAAWGYILGSSGGNSVDTERISFSTSTLSTYTTANRIADLTENICGLSDGAVYGYTTGGQGGFLGETPNTERITFSTTTFATHTPGNISTARQFVGAISDNRLYGYFLGGRTGNNSGDSNTADRLTFSTGTTAAYTLANLPFNAVPSNGALADFAV